MKNIEQQNSTVKSLNKGLQSFIQRFLHLWPLDIIIFIVFIVLALAGKHIPEFLCAVFVIYVLDFLHIQYEFKKENTRIRRLVLLLQAFNQFTEKSLKKFLEYNQEVNMNDIRVEEIVSIIGLEGFWSSSLEVEAGFTVSRKDFIKVLFKNVNTKLYSLDNNYADLLSDTSTLPFMDLYEELFYIQNFDLLIDYDNLDNQHFASIISFLININICINEDCNKLRNVM